MQRRSRAERRRRGAWRRRRCRGQGASRRSGRWWRPRRCQGAWNRDRARMWRRWRGRACARPSQIAWCQLVDTGSRRCRAYHVPEHFEREPFEQLALFSTVRRRRVLSRGCRRCGHPSRWTLEVLRMEHRPGGQHANSGWDGERTSEHTCAVCGQKIAQEYACKRASVRV